MMEDIHDIRPPVLTGIDPALIRLGIWIAAALVLAAVLFLGVRWFMTRKKQKQSPPALPVIAPYDTAVRELDRLGISPAHEPKVFYFDLGRILKTYVGAVYGFNCLEMTTQELGKRLRAINGLPAALKSDITGFQDLCDPFRYAPLAPDRERMNKDLSKGRALIDAMEKSTAVSGEGD